MTDLVVERPKRDLSLSSMTAVASLETYLYDVPRWYRWESGSDFYDEEAEELGISLKSWVLDSDHDLPLFGSLTRQAYYTTDSALALALEGEERAPILASIRGVFYDKAGDRVALGQMYDSVADYERDKAHLVALVMEDGEEKVKRTETMHDNMTHTEYMTRSFWAEINEEDEDED